MKNKFHAFLYFTATLLLLLNISSCSGIASPSEQESPSASRGLSLRGRFSLAEASAVPSEYQTATNAALQASRNAIPDTSTLTYSVSATNASNGNIVWATSANSTSYEFNGNLTAGTWEITAYAKQGTAVVLQSEPKTVTLSKLAMDASASLTMAPGTSGSGSINLPVSWASGSGIGYCNYSKPDGITITTTSGQPDRITAESIAPGIYTVTLTFYTSEDNYNSGVAPFYKCTEYLAVYPGLETNTWTNETAPHIDASGNFNVTKSCVETFVYRKIYVEQGASSSNANGTSERPYPSIESAMTRLSEVAGANIITGISATNPWELHVKGTLKAPSGIGQNFINVPSSVGHLKIVGEGSGATIDADSKCRVLNVASGANVTVQNITLKNGRTSFGGGVCISGTLTMNTGTAISDNAATSATGAGGGIYIENGGKFYLNGGTISNNEAPAAGGGVFVLSGGTFEMTGGSISSCKTTATNGVGGGLYASGNVKITGGSISGNSASDTGLGGGKNIYITSSATVTSIPDGDDSFYDDGTKQDGKADAVCLASGHNFARFNNPHSATHYISKVTGSFTGDATIYLGSSTGGDTTWEGVHREIGADCTHNLTIRPTKSGAKASISYRTSNPTTDSSIYLIKFAASGKTLTLTNITLNGINRCGVANIEAGTLSATNCTFKNGKSEKGGGIYVETGASATLSSCTVKDCRTEKITSAPWGKGGGIYTDGTVEFSGTIEDCSVKGIGGGVFVGTAANAKFKMTGGTIKNCKAEKETSESASTGEGGGVWAYQTFEMTGGTITGCTAPNTGLGAGVEMVSASSTPIFKISGDACVAQNNEVYLDSSSKITIAENLTSTTVAKIRKNSYTVGITQVLDGSTALLKNNYEKFVLATTDDYYIDNKGIVRELLTVSSSSTGTEIFDALQTSDIVKVKIPSGVTYKMVPDSSYPNSGSAKVTALIIPSGKSVTLTGSGTLSISEYCGDVIQVKGGTLNLKESVTITPSPKGNHWAAIELSSGGTLNMSGGTITGVSSGGGNGVVTVNRSCTFNMTGGSITSNRVADGPVDVSAGTFNMTGGSITNNSSNNNNGGVTVSNGGTFTKNGGTISGNKTDSNVTANVMIENYGTYNGTAYGSSSSPVDHQILY